MVKRCKSNSLFLSGQKWKGAGRVILNQICMKSFMNDPLVHVVEEEARTKTIPKGCDYCFLVQGSIS